MTQVYPAYHLRDRIAISFQKDIQLDGTTILGIGDTDPRIYNNGVVLEGFYSQSPTAWVNGNIASEVTTSVKDGVKNFTITEGDSTFTLKMTLDSSRQKIILHTFTQDFLSYNTMTMSPHITIYSNNLLAISNDQNVPVDITEEVAGFEEENTSSEPIIEDNEAALPEPEKLPSEEDAPLEDAAPSKDEGSSDGELSDLEPDSSDQT